MVTSATASHRTYIIDVDGKERSRLGHVPLDSLLGEENRIPLTKFARTAAALTGKTNQQTVCDPLPLPRNWICKHISWRAGGPSACHFVTPSTTSLIHTQIPVVTLNKLANGRLVCLNRLRSGGTFCVLLSRTKRSATVFWLFNYCTSDVLCRWGVVGKKLLDRLLATLQKCMTLGSGKYICQIPLGVENFHYFFALSAWSSPEEHASL